MSQKPKGPKSNPRGKVTIELHQCYPLLKREAIKNDRTAKAHAEFIIKQHLGLKP